MPDDDAAETSTELLALAGLMAVVIYDRVAPADHAVVIGILAGAVRDEVERLLHEDRDEVEAVLRETAPARKGTH